MGVTDLISTSALPSPSWVEEPGSLPRPERLSFTGRRWEDPTPVLNIPEEAMLPPWLRGLLYQRGIRGSAVGPHLSPSLAHLEDPGTMAHIDRAVERLLRAIQGGERIVVWGDYDVDGVCSTTVVVDFLQRVGAKVSYYIPDRLAEGYGLNPEAVAEIAQRAEVLVTCDCGITAVEPIAIANAAGTDVIVVDHHQVPEVLPPAYACLDPHRPDCAFPYKDLCATGVAFMLVGALRRALRDAGHFQQRDEPDLRDLLEVVAIATVADMVPLTGNNRVLLTAGMRRMAQTKRVGLQALLQVAEVNPQAVTTYDLGFRLGPRINARGRMSHAAEAVELMLTQDPARARVLAGALDAANKERRETEKQTVEAALQRLEEAGGVTTPGIVLYHENWHPGVLGLVATRLVQRFHRPAIVIGEGGKGSGRSIEGLDLYAAMAAGAHHVVRFGGHKAAAGLTILPQKVAHFAEAFQQGVLEQLGPPPYIQTLRPDLEVEPERLSLSMVDDLESLGPYGQAYPEPLLLSRQVLVKDRRVVGERHLKLRLGQAGHDAIAFGLGSLSEDLPQYVDVLYRLERNEFRGKVSLQLKIEDIRAAADPV